VSTLEPLMTTGTVMDRVSASAPDSVPLPLFELAKSKAAISETCLGIQLKPLHPVVLEAPGNAIAVLRSSIC